MTQLLELDQVYFSADGKDILNDVSLAFGDEERTSIEGASGSGKSTLLKTMGTLIPASQGQVFYKGRPIEEIDYTFLRKKVSYVHQTPQLFGETVQDNLAFPADIRRETFDEDKAQRFLSEVNMDYIDLDKDINSLSGGERQRVSLVRHLMYPPEMLLLDEITASLDRKISQVIWDWLFDQADQHKISLVWISHQEKDQALANRHISIKDGVVVNDDKEEA